MGTKHSDQLKGGLADKKKVSDFDAEQLKIGTQVEMEHTHDASLAREIAMDHLAEHPDYYKKLRVMEQQMKSNVAKTVIEVTSDGKQEILPGKEPLKKDPRKKKNKLWDRWQQLKKALDHATAIGDLRQEEQEDDDEESKEDTAADQPESAQAEQETPPEGTQAEQEAPTETPPEGAQAEQETPSETPPEGAQAEQEAPPEGAQAEQEAPPEGAQEPVPEDATAAPDLEELISALQSEGYTDPEIAYIVHGHHSPPVNMSDRAHAEATSAMSAADVDAARRIADLNFAILQRKADHEHAHKARMADLEYERAQKNSTNPSIDGDHKKRMLDLEYEDAKNKRMKAILDHEQQQRMMDLDYEIARQEKQLELEFKKKEHELKLRIMEDSMKQQARQKAPISRETFQERRAKAAESKK